jgi:hypothetical protein
MSMEGFCLLRVLVEVLSGTEAEMNVVAGESALWLPSVRLERSASGGFDRGRPMRFLALAAASTDHA